MNHRVTALLSAALCVLSADAFAQPAPAALPAAQAIEAPPALPPPPDDAAERALITRASDLLAQGRAAEAQRAIDLYLASASLPTYSALPVLQRLAARMTLRPPALAAPEANATRGARSGVELFELYTLGFTYGLGTGAYLDVMLRLEDVRSAVWIPLVLGGAGLVTAYLADRGTPVRRGRASAANSGMLLGALAGLSLAGTLDHSLTSGPCAYSAGGYYGGGCGVGLTAREYGTSTWLGATLGLGVGIGLGVLTDATPAASSFVFAGGVWGAAFGVLGAALTRADSPWLAMLVSEGVGAGLAAIGAHALHPAEAQVRWMNLGVLAGGLLGLGVGILPGSESTVAIVLPIQLGMIAGGIGGYLLGAPSPGDSHASAALHRFRADPSVTPTLGGATVGVNFPNLL